MIFFYYLADSLDYAVVSGYANVGGIVGFLGLRYRLFVLERLFLFR